MEKLLVDTIEENFKRINENICNAALKAGRNSKEIALLAATKTVPPDIINSAISLGITDIGENRVQELNSKYDSLKLENCNLHMIGHLQTNKVKKIVGKVKCIQSVDSLKLMTEINRVSSINNITSDILVEVNIGREKNKSGVLPEYLEDLLVILGFLLCDSFRLLIDGALSLSTLGDFSPFITKNSKAAMIAIIVTAIWTYLLFLLTKALADCT